MDGWGDFIASKCSCINCEQKFSITKLSPLKGRIPLVLPCNHTVCDGCAKECIKTSLAVECNVCHILHNISTEVNSSKPNNDDSWIRSLLPVNLYLLGMLVMNLNQNQSQQGIITNFDPKFKTKGPKQLDKINSLLQLPSTELCSQCNGGAEIKCQQCDVYLCSHCFSIIHGSFAPLQKHQKVPIGSVKFIETLTVCPTHKDKNLEFFCDDCEKYICFSCMFTGTSCNQHKMKSLAEKNAAMIEDLQQRKEGADEIYRRLNKTLNVISTLLDNPAPKKLFPQKESSVITRISSHFARLHAVAQIREKELIKILEDANFSERKDLASAKEDIFKNLGDIDEVLTVCEYALKEENRSKVNFTQLEAKLKEINKYPWYLSKQQTSEEENDKDSVIVDEEIFDVVNRHATVTSGKHFTYKLLSTEDIPADVEVPPIPEAPVQSEYTIAKELRQLKLTKTVSDLGVANVSVSNSSANSVASSEVSSRDGQPAFQHKQPFSKQPKGKHNKPPAPFSELSINVPKSATNQQFIHNHQNLSNSHQNYRHKQQQYANNQQKIPLNNQHFPNHPRFTQNYQKYSYQQNPDGLFPPTHMPKNSRNIYNSLFHKNNNVPPHQKNVQTYSAPQKSPSQPKQLEIGLVEIVMVSFIQNPHNFYIHRSHCNQKLNEMSLSFQTAASWPAPEFDKIQEELLLVFHQNAWLRAKVLKLEEEKYSVYCVDQGFIISVTMDKFRLLPPQYATVPWMATKCKLVKIEPVDGKWSYENSVFMTRIINNQPVVIQVVGLKKNNVQPKDGLNSNPEPFIECNLASQENQKEFAVDVADALVYAGEATLSNRSINVNKTFFYQLVFGGIQSRNDFYSANALPTKQLSIVVLTNVEHPGKFFIRKAQNDPEYIKLILEINKHYDIDDSTGVVYVPEIGMNVACNVPMNPTEFLDSTKLDIKDAQGGTWLRGKITKLLPNRMISVFLVDIGHMVSVNNLSVRRLEQTFMRMNILALECELFEVKPADSWSPESAQFVREFSGREMKVWTVNRNQKQRVTRVILYDPEDDGKPSVNKQLVEKGYAIATGTTIDGKVHSASPPRVYSGITSNAPSKDVKKIKILNDDGIVRLEVKVISAKSPSEVYVSLVSQQEALKQLFDDMNEFYEGSKSVSSVWKENDKCAVLHPERGWSRANVNEVLSDGDAELFLMDHAIATVASLEDVRQLNAEFSTVRDGAIKCHLNGLTKATDGDWPKLTCECLKELVEKYGEVYISKGGEVRSDSLPVDAWVVETTPGGALDPVKRRWLKLNDKLIDQGLALPTEKNKISIFETLKEGSKIMDEWLMIIDDSKPDHSVSEGNRKSEITTSKIFSEWLPAPLPLEKREFTAISSYVDYDLDIYLHDVGQNETLNFILSELNRQFKDTEPSQKDMYWTVGQPCIAEFSLDGNFYRGKISEILEDKLIVAFVDYGNVEECDVSKVRKAAVLCDIPVQCYRCKLVGIRPESDQYTRFVIDFLHKTVVDKEASITVVDEAAKEPIPIKVMLGDMDISNMMISLGFVVDSSDAKKVYSVARGHFRESNANDVASDSETECAEEPFNTEGTSVELDLSEAETDNWAVQMELDEKRERAKQCKYVKNNFPGGFAFECNVEGIVDGASFCLRLLSPEFDELMLDIQEGAPGQPRVLHIYEFKPCIALYEGDRKWYRAEVLNFDNVQKVAKVMFVDYGNVELVRLKEMRESRLEWCEMSPKAISGRLRDISVSKFCLDSEVVETLKTLVLNRDLNGRIVAACETTLKDSLLEAFYVELFNPDTGEPVYQTLVDRELYTRIAVKEDN